MPDIATTIMDLARAANDSVQVQYMQHPDWPTGYWLVYLGLTRAGTGATLAAALTAAGESLARRTYTTTEG